MVAEMARLPLPEPDDSHPLDWYPGDEPESRTVEEAETWVRETLTRREHGKIETGADDVCTVPAPHTARLFGSPAMPSHDISPAVNAAIQAVARQLQAQPRPAGKPQKWGLRRGATRGAGKMPMIYYMQCQDCGLIKIGVSGDYRLRKVELERRTPHKHLDVLAIESGDLWCEAQTHSRLFKDCVGGEWYRPSAEVLAYIARYAHPPFEQQG